MSLEIRICSGVEIDPWLEVVSRLRVRLFSEFPYLYVGNDDYEAEYGAGFRQADAAVVAVAHQDGVFAGLATALPLAQAPFILRESEGLLRAAGLAPESLFYLSETLVEPGFQGKGIGTALLSARREAGRSLGYAKSCLMAVDRALDHVSRPRGMRTPVPLWSRHGYKPIHGHVFFEYPTRLPDGSVATIPNPMVFWHD